MALELQVEEDASSRDRLDPDCRKSGGGRILWLIRGDEGYGYRRANDGMISLLRSKSFEMGFVAMREGAFSSELASAGFPVWYLDSEFNSADVVKSGWGFLRGAAKLFQSSGPARDAVLDVIDSFQPDWIHISINRLLTLGSSAARKRGVPVYWHIHNTISSKLPFGLQARLLRLACRFYRIHAMANSRHTADSLGMPRNRSSVLYPGVDPDFFSADARFNKVAREDLGLAAGRPAFLIGSRLVPEKGQDLVVRAAVDLLKEGLEFSLILAGGPVDSPYARSIAEVIESNSLGDRIKMIGQVEDIRGYLEIADVVINSRVNAEPFGLTIVEAMLMERPVLAYACGGPTETVVNGETGWHVEESTVEAYRTGLKRALNQSHAWPSMGRKARARAESLYSVAATVDEYLRITEATPNSARR